MPTQEKRHTLLRQWELLKAIPSYQECPVGRTAAELTETLKAAGYDIDVRSTQRDLNELSGVFPIEANDKARPFGWRWARQAHIGLPGLGLAEALALKLVEDHLRQLLPPTLLTSLEGLFKQAETQLAAVQGKNRAADWPAKVRSVPPAQPLLAPMVDEAIQAELAKALLEGQQVRARYRPAGSDEAKEYVLHPLGIVLRGVVLYLVATAFGYQDVRTYAFHRFEAVERLDDRAVVPEGFDLDREIGKGLADFVDGGETVKLDLTCDAELAFYLGETPLSADQQMKKRRDGRMRVIATVNNTWQLRWWLLSQGAKVEVLGPKWLRGEIGGELEMVVELYN
jgi:predicted DNA-binding transcriptional regulator YafY